jgi:adenine-specific DNA-methyltransferase
VIKYLGSKRTLVPVLGRIASAVGARTAVDLFTGTTRVAQELKRRGMHVTAVDTATYSAILAECFIATDAREVDSEALDGALAELDALPGTRGYFTETFCETARFLQPKNGRRVDAIRTALEERYAGTPLHPILLTSLLLAADRVDSTTGLQMAFLKEWAPRAHRDLALRRPELLDGGGHAVLGNALRVVDDLPAVDLAYLDPPYNQHRYVSNYHVWETLVRWDAPEHYGIACKRVDVRDDASLRSPFNSRTEAPAAMADLLTRVRAGVVVVSYNDESWVTPAQMTRWLKDAGHDEVAVLSFDQKRYVGAQIGIHGPTGEKVGTVSRLRNQEYVFVAGDRDRVAAAVAGEAEHPRAVALEPAWTMGT